MSLRARRARDEDFDRHHALAARRDAVIAATVKRAPDAGSSATLDAVDEALAELYAAGAHSGQLEQVAALWIHVAYWRLVDEQRSTHVRRRERIAVEEHLQALSLSTSAELGDFTDERHVWWRVRELLAALHGEQRTWAEAWLRQVCGALKPGAQPRGLDEILGWSHAKTEKTAQRARSTMVAFVNQRARGALCRQQGGLLDAFTATSDTAEQAATLEQRFESALFHVAGCADCSAAWRARRRTLAERCSPALMLPLEGVTAVAHAAAAKLAGLLAGAQNATLSVLGRLGIGGGAAVGGSAVTLTAKTAAVCATVVCAATAGGELTGALAPIVSIPAHHHRDEAARKAPHAPLQQASRHLVRPTVAVSYATRVRRMPATTAARNAPPTTSTPPVTPGDLPLASATPAPAPAATFSASSATAPRAAVSTRTPPCFPGDLGC